MSGSPRFELLLKELEHADRQISSYMDLQMKILGFVFAFLGLAMGLLLTGKLPERLDAISLAQLLVLVSAVGSFGVLQSCINYGVALGYIYNKERFIAPRLQSELALAERPLFAVRAFRASPACLPVMLSTFVVVVGIDVLNVALLYKVFNTAGLGGITWILALAASVLVVFVVVMQILMGIAMRRTGIAPLSLDAKGLA